MVYYNKTSIIYMQKKVKVNYKQNGSFLIYIREKILSL